MKVVLALPSNCEQNYFSRVFVLAKGIGVFNLSYEAFKDCLLDIRELRDAALIATTYAGYARIGEIVRNKASCKPNPPLNKGQIEITPSHMLLSIKTEKTLQWRKVPVSREKEAWLVNIIQKWLSICDYELFPYSTRWAEKRFEKYFDTQRIHLLRHWATTHALQGHRTKELLPPQYIAKFGGWTQFDTFYRTYWHYIVEDFIDKV